MRMNKNTTFLLLMLTGVFNLSYSQTTLVTNESEFNTAVENAKAGDTIKLKDGTWTDVELAFFAEGEKGNPVVLTAENAGGVILTGSSMIEIYGKYLEVHNLDFRDGELSGDPVVSFRRSSSQLAENCRLTNCRILNYNPPTDDIEYKWVSIYGKNNRVDHCTFTGKNHEGALLVVWLNGSANNHRIDHNYFSDIPRLNRNGAETIRIGTSTNSFTDSRTIVEYNVFEKCDGELEIISNKSKFNVYRYNTFINNNGVLTLRHGNDCDVYGNFFFGASNKACGGVRIIGEGHKVYNNYFQDLLGTGARAAISMMNGVPNSPLNRYFQVKNAEVVHNTIVSCKQAFAFGVGKNDELSLPPLNCIVANNIVDKTNGAPISYIDNPINLSYTKNYIFSELNIEDEGLINEDPGLSFEEGLWRPERSSVVVNASVGSYSYLNEDIDGQKRDDIADIGCDELSQSEILNKPLKKEDVGAMWDKVIITNIEDIKLFNPNVTLYNNRLKVSNMPFIFGPYQLYVYNSSYHLVSKFLISQEEQEFNLHLNNGVYIIKIIGDLNVFSTSTHLILN